MPQDAIGLDIGGANLKAATASGSALEVPFELWRHPERLAAELVLIRERWPDIKTVAVTMTGELCDCFPTKRDGVRQILAAVEAVFPRHAIGVWSTVGRFVPVHEANRTHLQVAAANWHALATVAGRIAGDGPALLIDTGSTTTDIIPLVSGVPMPTGLTDPERLISGELVYTGVRRTPVCALLMSGVAGEWFATAHDVYVRLGLMAEEPANRATADGRPMTVETSHARLSRMVCGDPEITSMEATASLARRAFAAQKAAIGASIRRVLDRLPGHPRKCILAGSGTFLARAAWSGVGGLTGAAEAPVIEFAERWGPDLSAAACAYAVAVLATEDSR